MRHHCLDSRRRRGQQTRDRRPGGVRMRLSRGQLGRRNPAASCAQSVARPGLSGWPPVQTHRTLGAQAGAWGWGSASLHQLWTRDVGGWRFRAASWEPRSSRGDLGGAQRKTQPMGPLRIPRAAFHKALQHRGAWGRQEPSHPTGDVLLSVPSVICRPQLTAAWICLALSSVLQPGTGLLCRRCLFS